MVSGKEVDVFLSYTDRMSREIWHTFSRRSARTRSDRYMDFLDYSLHISEQMRSSDEPLNVIFDTINRDLSGEFENVIRY